MKEAREPARIETAGEQLASALSAYEGCRVRAGDAGLAEALTGAGELLATISSLVAGLPQAGPEAATKRMRVSTAAVHLLADVRLAAALGERDVAWVEPDWSGETSLRLRVAPVDVGPILVEKVFAHRPVVLTSATLSVGGSLAPFAHRVGLRPPLLDAAEMEAPELLRVDSPFDFEERALLYCAKHLPDPRSPEFAGQAAEELGALMTAAGGRTLALFTSRRAMERAYEVLDGRFDFPLLVQGEGPRGALLQRFRDDERASLLATMSFWQGVDVVGSSLSLVVIDRLPFPRPDEPLAEARGEAKRAEGLDPFTTVDLVRACTLLAQGVGRLIRSGEDRGVVAVLDRRLASARYRWTVVRSLPPMRRTSDRDETLEFLGDMAAASGRSDR